MKKFLEEKDRLHTKVINLANKVKEQEKQLQHMVNEDSVNMEGFEKEREAIMNFLILKRRNCKNIPSDLEF